MSEFWIRAVEWHTAHAVSPALAFLHPADAFIAFMGPDERIRDSGQSGEQRKLTKRGDLELRRLLCPLRCYVPAPTSTWNFAAGVAYATWNLFALGVEKICLTGRSAVSPNSKLRKTLREAESARRH